MMGLGVVLWLIAGLLPVLRLRSLELGLAEVTVQTTWMGVAVLKQHLLAHATGARVKQTPPELGGTHIELFTDEGQIPIHIRSRGGQTSPAYLSRIVDHYAKNGGPRVLVLPLRSRLSLMLRFALLFPLGTASLFIGGLLLARSFG
jgi:hypothetical protein